MRVAQPVEWRSPKPQDDGSTPSPYTNRRGQPGVLCGQMRFTVNHTVGHNGMQGIPCRLPAELEARLHLGLAAGVRGIHLVTVIPSEAWWRTGRQCACLLRYRRRMPNGVYVQCFLSRLGSVFPQFGLLVSRSVGAVWAGGAYEEGIGPPNLAYRSKCVDYVAGLPLWQ